MHTARPGVFWVALPDSTPAADEKLPHGPADHAGPCFDPSAGSGQAGASRSRLREADCAQTSARTGYWRFRSPIGTSVCQLALSFNLSALRFANWHLRPPNWQYRSPNSATVSELALLLTHRRFRLQSGAFVHPIGVSVRPEPVEGQDCAVHCVNEKSSIQNRLLALSPPGGVVPDHPQSTDRTAPLGAWGSTSRRPPRGSPISA